jgi:hypothetical protein
MTALAANRERSTRNKAGQMDGQVTGVDSDEFYEGGLVSWSAAAATIVPSSDTTLERCVGVCTERVTTGSSNTTKVKYTYGHDEWFEHTGLATAQEGDSVYISDDNIVTDYAGSTNKIRAGVFRELETVKGTAGAWVFLDGLSDANAGGGQLVVGGAPLRQWNHAGEGALISRGTSAAFGTAGDIMYAGWVPRFDQTVTNLNVLNATTVGTDKVIYGIYSVGGTLLRSTALAGATSAGADVYQEIALTATLAIYAGVEYLVAAQMEGTTAQLQFTAANFRGGTGRTGVQAGSFGTMAAISSVASTFTADKGPLFFTS